MKTAQSIFSKASNTSELTGYKDCDREQIHLLGHIQPHGVLICIDESDFRIVQVSENTAKFFGLSANSLLNQPLTILFPQAQIEKLQSCLSQKDIEVFNP
jgi:light-regulated signal transduction histidine kinase (bacteriophytochrome)